MAPNRRAASPAQPRTMAARRSVRNLKTINSIIDGRAPEVVSIKRWDGNARTSEDWSNLQRDPDLWFPEGNCLVHLYAKDHSRKGPSFRVPFSGLLAAKCYPLIERFLELDGPRPRNLRDLHKLGSSPRRTIELYIPSPPAASPETAFRCSIAIRNLFAWLYGQPLVGEHLGRALVGVMHSLLEFRAAAANSAEDMVTYLTHAGYLNLACQPNYAVACLQLAETFQMRDLYIRAFAHCVGMNDHLFDCLEYQHISFFSRKLLRIERSNLDSRLYQATDMLQNFAEHELSEAHMGFSAGARAHLEHFRSFLMSFYTQQLGYFPPRSFDPDMYRAMREDFEALYELLVDESYTMDDHMPSLAVGGICTLQHVQYFDNRHDFDALNHPLPLLPYSAPTNSSKRMTWLPRADKVKPSQRLAVHTALINASNWKESVFRNDLVRAYRKFEEDLVISPQKADKREKLSIVDARKVRWILVYALYQVLRNVTDEPPEVRDDLAVPYHLSISTENLPPWEEATDPRDFPEHITPASATSPLVTWSDGESKHTAGGIEIKPDIDYFALTHKEPSTERKGSAQSTSDNTPSISRSNSFSRILARSHSIRKSMGLFKSTTPPDAPPMPSMRQPYHEIVVHGYGNGTNNVSFEPGAERTEPGSWATRSDSTSSNYSSNSAPTLDSTDSTETDDSIVKTPVHVTAAPEFPFEKSVEPHCESQGSLSEVISPAPKFIDSKPIRRRTMTALLDSRTYTSSHQSSELDNVPAVPPRNPRRRNSLMTDLRRMSYLPGSRSAPVQEEPIPDDRSDTSSRYSDDWSAMEAFMGDVDARIDTHIKSVMSALEQYSDLGGLTEVK